MAGCARDRAVILTRNASRIRPGATVWQNQKDKMVRAIAFANRQLNDAKKVSQWNNYNYYRSYGELKNYDIHHGRKTVNIYNY